MSELTPKESAALRARIVEGADGLPPRGHNTSRMVAITTSVIVVGVVAVGVGSLALGLGSTNDTMATPTPAPSVSQSATPSPAPSPSLSPTPTGTPTPNPTPTTPLPVVLENGQSITTSEEWDLLVERGWGHYVMPNDIYIATDPMRDFPAEVTADIQRRLDAIPNNTTAEADQTTALLATDKLRMEVHSSTQKEIVTLRCTPVSTPNAPTMTALRWSAMSSQEGWWMPLSNNRDQLLADVNAWIAANTAPGSWAVFVGPGEPVIP